MHDASTDDNVLVIGEPACDETVYPPLPGARSEAIAVAQRLARPDVGVSPDRVKLLADRDDAQTVINALFERSYRIVHIAGHGAPRRDGGVVLSGTDTFLGANEVRAMRVKGLIESIACFWFDSGINLCNGAALEGRSRPGSTYWVPSRPIGMRHCRLASMLATQSSGAHPSRSGSRNDIENRYTVTHLVISKWIFVRARSWLSTRRCRWM